MTGYQRTASAMRSPVTQRQVVRQCRTYQNVYRIPAEIIRNDIGTPLVRMPVSAHYSALIMPHSPAAHLLLQHVCAAAIKYPLIGRTAVLMYPDVRIEERLRRQLAHAHITMAESGTHLDLPIEGSECPWEWLRQPSIPAQWPKLSELIATLWWSGIAGRRGKVP